MTNPNRDRRRWGLPTANEIAVIPGNGTQSYGRRDIVVHRQDGPLLEVAPSLPALPA
ncbi:hypothetical protein BDM02DRAFT_3123382 [Thelephora ganbajun]|uniref:Uncharacterized protein n=1 Tax=Thelephora ganbajun TaxID=370292 RepID=A0ACB6Z1K2_THEGA|nr:hypothetical protein BDM02DRAFT_3123382 [Thelephora ganbajun]